MSFLYLLSHFEYVKGKKVIIEDTYLLRSSMTNWYSTNETAHSFFISADSPKDFEEKVISMGYEIVEKVEV